ncbi:MAG: hypothetical protein JST84_25035 [Acidobacteria bacterium]|nr:hypothetical protein [Acidobacteriota bacterium]
MKRPETLCLTAQLVGMSGSTYIFSTAFSLSSSGFTGTSQPGRHITQQESGNICLEMASRSLTANA